jgi:predicted extracellular nuclease
MLRCRLLTTLLLAVSFTASANADLIISEYVEGSSNNKAIELFNTGIDDIDLTDARLRFFFNGSTSPGNTISNLTGVLAPGDVYVVADDDFALLGALIDLTYGGSSFNGDDAVELSLDDGTVLDVIGQIGSDPGTQWGSGDQSTQNNTITRNVNILSGDTNGTDAFDPSIQWRGGANDSHSLGFHDGQFSSVPEPASASIIGLVGLGLLRRRRAA